MAHEPALGRFLPSSLHWKIPRSWEEPCLGRVRCEIGPIALFTHVQICSSTAPILVEMLRSFSFFPIVSTLAAILLIVVTLDALAAVYGAVGGVAASAL